MASQFRKERHSVSDLKVYLVCVTKYRQPVLTAEGLGLVEKSFREVALKMGFEILEFNGEADHTQALIEFPPKLSISQIVNALKGVSSRRYGQAGLRKPLATTPLGQRTPAQEMGVGREALWSPSYYASTVGGAPLETLEGYIQGQERPSEKDGVSDPNLR